MVLVLGCAAVEGPIVFSSDRDGNMEIYSGQPNGDDQTNLTNTPEDEFAPILSRDKRLIAFRSGPEADSTIGVMRIDGTERTQVTTSSGRHRTHRWDPDGERLAFVGEEDGESVVRVATIEDSESVLLTAVPGDEVGDWSRDGKSVAFAVRKGDAQGIYVRNPDGVNEFRVTDTPDYAPVWSPDSRRVAFMSTRDGNPEIYVMDADGSEQIRMTKTDADEYDVSWSPDGKTLLFVSDREGNPEIFIVDLEDRKQTRLTHNNTRDDQPVWAPDGKRIAFVSYLDGDGEIIVMDSKGENQSRVTNNDGQDDSPSW